MTYLYIKEHVDTGLKYFGKTAYDPYKYQGSGKYWKRHIKTHGKNIKTLWTCEFENDSDLNEFALFFSEFFDITKSKEWANLRPENGFDGAPIGYVSNGAWKAGQVAATNKITGSKRPEHSKKMKVAYAEGKIFNFETPSRLGVPHTPESKEKIRKSIKENRMKAVCCIACHKSNTDDEGLWMCHYSTHHKNCV